MMIKMCLHVCVASCSITTNSGVTHECPEGLQGSGHLDIFWTFCFLMGLDIRFNAFMGTGIFFLMMMCGKMLMWYGVGGCVKQGQVLRDKAVGDFTGN